MSQGSFAVTDDVEGKQRSGGEHSQEGNARQPSARVRLLERTDRRFGEAFERYYRREILQRLGKRLRLIAAEPLLSVRDPSFMNELDDSTRSFLTLKASELADSLYQLTSRLWEPNPNVYLRTIDDSIASLSCGESRFLLRTTQKIFTDRYGEIIRDRGESIELLDQIVKRTGEETGEGFLKVLSGVDVTDLAWKIWEFLQRREADRVTKLERILLDLTEYQVRELRLEYNMIPAILLARELHRALHVNPQEDEPIELDEELLEDDEPESEPDPDADEWDFGDDIVEEEEQDPYTVDFEAIDYLLRGRTREEIELIEFHFNDLYHRQSGEPELRQQVLDRMVLWKAEEVLRLLDGFSPEAEAEAIWGILQEECPLGLFEISLTEFAETLEFRIPSENEEISFDTLKWKEETILNGYIPVLDDLVERFQPVREKREDDSLESRECRALLRLRQAVHHLSPEQFHQVNGFLKNRFGVALSPALYDNGQLFHARRRAELLVRWIPISRTVPQLLWPLEYLRPEQLDELRDVYLALTARELRDDIRARVQELCAGEVTARAAQQIERRLSGMPRLATGKDLLGYLNEQRDAAIDDATLQQGFELIHERNWRGLSTYLQRMDSEQRSAFEAAWISAQEGGAQPLHALLKESGSVPGARECLLLLAEVDPGQLLNEIQQDPSHLIRIASFEPEYVEYVTAEALAAGTDLWIIAERLDRKSARQLFTALYLPLAAKFGTRLFTEKGVLDDETKALTEEIFALPYDRLSCFERAFDTLYGSLRLVLKQLCSDGLLRRAELSSMMLRLEGLPAGAHRQLRKCIDIADFERIQKAFRSLPGQLETLEEAYDTEFQEPGMRLDIDQMDASLNAICRTLLLLDEYDPDEVAKELVDVIGSLSGQALLAKLEEILAPPTDDHPNPRIPMDMNWVEEMYLQIRHSYRALTGRVPLTDIFARGISEDFGKDLAYRLYGKYVAEKAAEIYTAIRARKSGEERLEGVVHVLGPINPRVRECIVDLYDAFFASRPNHRTLEEELQRFQSKDKLLLAKALKIVRDARIEI